MGNLTATKHGDVANDLFKYYQDKATELENSGQFYMAAITLALAVETALLIFLLFGYDEEKDEEPKIPDDLDMFKIIEIADQNGILNAPINIPSLIRDEEDKTLPKYIGRDVIHKIRKFRNMIHPARALSESFNPRAYTSEQLEELKDMYESVMHCIMYNI